MAAFTNISQMKVGMRVRCVFPSHDRTGKTATVVRLGPGVDVEWDDGNPYKHWAYATSFEPADQMGIEFDCSSSPTITQARQEKPCQVCGRNNDVGVKVCWNCGNQPEYI